MTTKLATLGLAGLIAVGSAMVQRANADETDGLVKEINKPGRFIGEMLGFEEPVDFEAAAEKRKEEERVAAAEKRAQEEHELKMQLLRQQLMQNNGSANGQNLEQKTYAAPNTTNLNANDRWWQLGATPYSFAALNGWKDMDGNGITTVPTIPLEFRGIGQKFNLGDSESIYFYTMVPDNIARKGYMPSLFLVDSKTGKVCYQYIEQKAIVGAAGFNMCVDTENLKKSNINGEVRVIFKLRDTNGNALLDDSPSDAYDIVIEQ